MSLFTIPPGRLGDLKKNLMIKHEENSNELEKSTENHDEVYIKKIAENKKAIITYKLIFLLSIVLISILFALFYNKF